MALSQQSPPEDLGGVVQAQMLDTRVENLNETFYKMLRGACLRNGATHEDLRGIARGMVELILTRLPADWADERNRQLELIAGCFVADYMTVEVTAEKTLVVSFPNAPRIH